MSLRLEQLCHRFGPHSALQEVSLHVERGDCYGFIGHNGAGKTTTMRIALGLLHADSGRVLVDGFDAARYPTEARARLGALVETPGFHGHWGGRRNLELLARLGGMGRARARSESDRLLELVGLGGVGPKAVGGYSQGMRQRLGVAQAFLGDPPYVLLDEPFRGLDPEGVAEMRDLLRRLTRDEGKTVVVSSHQLHELAGLCNRVGVLRQGRVMAQEPLDRLLHGGETRYLLRSSELETADGFFRDAGLVTRAVDDGLEVELDGQPAPALVRRLVEAGVAVEAFAPRPPSLEEVYLRHTRGDAGSAQPAAAERAAAGPPAERRAARRPIWRMFRHEAKRWGGRLAVPLLLLAPLPLALYGIFARKATAIADEAAVEQETLFSTTDVTAWEGVARAFAMALPLLPFLVLALASQSVAAEYSQGTLRNVMLRPLRRVHVAWGKALAVLGFMLAAYAALVAVALAASAWAFDFSDLTEILPNGEVWEWTKAADLWPDLRRLLWKPILPLAAFAGIGFLAGSVTRSAATALGLALGGGVALNWAGSQARSYHVESWFPTTYLPTPLLDRTSFVAYFSRVAEGASDAVYRYEGRDLWVPALWAATTFALATLVLRRRYVP